MQINLIDKFYIFQPLASVLSGIKLQFTLLGGNQLCSFVQETKTVVEAGSDIYSPCSTYKFLITNLFQRGENKTSLHPLFCHSIKVFCKLFVFTDQATLHTGHRSPVT